MRLRAHNSEKSWDIALAKHDVLPPNPHCAQIQVGNFNQTIATLQLGGSETAIVVSIVICSVLLLLSVVGR